MAIETVSCTAKLNWKCC